MLGALRQARAAYALLLAGALVRPDPLAAQSQGEVGRVAALVGSAFVVHHGASQPEPLREGARVFEGDRIETRSDSRLRLELEDGSVLQLGETTDLYVDWVLLAPAYGSRNVVLEMSFGIIRTVVEALVPRSFFELRTETAITSVRGTDWIAEASPQATAVVSLEGEVVVGSRAPAIAGTVVLGPGEGTTVEAGAAPTEPSVWGDARRESFIERTALPAR